MYQHVPPTPTPSVTSECGRRDYPDCEKDASDASTDKIHQYHLMMQRFYAAGLIKPKGVVR